MSKWVKTDTLLFSLENIRSSGMGKRLSLDTLKEQIINNSEEIIRCKECKHNPKGIGWVSCPMTGANTRKPDDFCSYGEREGE